MLKKHIRILIIVLLMALILIGGVLAAVQSYEINWWTADGGGGILTGGNYRLRGTLGQADFGVMEGGEFSLQGGFWGISASSSGYNVFLPLTVK